MEHVETTTQSEPHGGLPGLAQRLYRVLTDGAPGPLRFNIRNGCQLRDGASKEPIFASYTDKWRPARDRLADGTERPRVASWGILHQHLLGRYDVAIQAPSWSSLVVLDIDRPELAGADVGDPLAELRADGQRDQVLAAVWRAYQFGAERQPVILSTPGGGYHVYLPHCRDEARRGDQHPWPIAWARQRHEHHLDRARLGLKPGVLELYPTGVPLRAPCGRGMALLVPRNPDDPDDLQLELWHARWETARDRKTGRPAPRLRRDVVPLVREFLERLEAARRPLESWLDPAPLSPAWGARYGPFGDRSGDAAAPLAPLSYQHKVDVSKLGAGRPPAPGKSDHLPPACAQKPAGQEGHGGSGSASQGSDLRADGHLLYGKAFRQRIAQLQAFGLETAGERHDAALKLAYFHHVCRRLTVEETEEEIRAWLLDPRHVSATKARSAQTFVEDTLREVRHYLRKHLARARSAEPPDAKASRSGRLGTLVAADEAVVTAVADDVRSEVRVVLAYLATYADDSGRVPHPVALSAAMLEGLAGQRRIAGPGGERRRATLVALEELERLGVLAVHKQYAVGRHGRQFTCWYRFGSGVLPQMRPELGLVLGSREVAEGELLAVHGGLGEPPRAHFATVREGLVEALTRSDAWWVRMYARRAFTPAEFFDADQRHVLPGPFRDRAILKSPPVAESLTSVQAPQVPTAVQDALDEFESLRLAVAAAEAAGDMDGARRALVALWTARRARDRDSGS